MYYGLLGTLVTVFVGILISWITKHSEKNEFDERLLHPFIRNLLHSKEENTLKGGNTEYLKIKSNSKVYIISDNIDNKLIFKQNGTAEILLPKYSKTQNM